VSGPAKQRFGVGGAFAALMISIGFRSISPGSS
jgi:hypothetical protein